VKVRQLKSKDGKRTLLVRGRELLVTGNAAALADVRMRVFRILGMAPTAPVTIFLFE
jgi:hypothetical protein